MNYRVRIKERNGVTYGHLLFWAAFSMVSFGLGQVGNAGGLLLAAAGGGWAPFLGSPQSGLTTWLGWHTPEPCGPNLDIWNTGVNWGPSVWNTTLTILGSFAIPLVLTCGPSSATSRYAVGWGGPVPDQFGHYGNLGNLKYFCLSIISHGLCVWDYLMCCWGCDPALLLSGQPSAWLFGLSAQWLLQHVWWSLLT